MRDTLCSVMCSCFHSNRALLTRISHLSDGTSKFIGIMQKGGEQNSMSHMEHQEESFRTIEIPPLNGEVSVTGWSIVYGMA